MKNGIRNRVKVIRYEQEASKYGIKRSIVWRLADWAFFGIHKAALARKMSAICEWTGNIVASWAPNPLPANLGIEWGELFCNYKANKNVPDTSTRESFKIVLGSSMLSFNLSSLLHTTSHSVCRYWRGIHNPKRAQKPHDRHAGAIQLLLPNRRSHRRMRQQRATVAKPESPPKSRNQETWTRRI
jgi:hypothetical protein